jgi:hypothetical protein
MNELAIVLEKLSNVHMGVISARDDNVSMSISAGEKSPPTNIPGEAVGYFFSRAASLLIQLKKLSPALYGDFPHIAAEPILSMLNPIDESEAPWHYSITQLDQLIRDIYLQTWRG